MKSPGGEPMGLLRDWQFGDEEALATLEATEILMVSASTIERDWRFARAWLYRVLNDA